MILGSTKLLTAESVASEARTRLSPAQLRGYAYVVVSGIDSYATGSVDLFQPALSVWLTQRMFRKSRMPDS